MANFLSFFTIQSNIFAAGVLIAAALSNRFGALRGAATLYIATTGLVYALLLAGLEESLQTTLHWVNFVLHYFTPAAVVADWAIAPARLGGSYVRIIASWLSYPLLYCIYSLIRGALIGWYPYPFINPANGIGTVTLAIVGIAIAEALFATLIIWYGRSRVRL
ncbi:MAG: Pr6Pr family membrane protein [Candidatus Eremiobacteraeota bacterium]|nr:Pr6Pr family membrane protein [Candidatus Eremiobacteraeota bacterium]